jgi:hypothetical protein
MSSKISALPAQGFVAMADQFVCIDAAPINFRVTKVQFLNAAPGESIQMQNGTSLVGIDAAGQLLGIVTAPNTITIRTSASAGFTVDAFGNTLVSGAAGATASIGANAAFILFTAVGGITMSVPALQNIVMAYTPTVPADWAVLNPDVWQALDRIAAAIVARTVGGPV